MRSIREPMALRFAFLLAALIAAAPALAEGPGAAPRRPRPQHEIKLGTLAPEGSTWMKVMRDMDAAVRTATDNRVGFKFYPGGVQGDELVALKKIRLGQLQGGGFSGQGLGEIAPPLRVLELPFLFENSAEVDAVHAKIDPTLERIFEEKGYVLLGWAELGFIYLFTDRPVKSPDDLKQVKMWLYEGDPLAGALFSAYGISPIPLAPTDVITALDTKLINGVYCSPLACIALQWFTRISNMTDLRITHATGAVVIDRRAWEAIDAADREKVRAAASPCFRRLIESTRSENEKSIQVMKQRGIQIITPDPARVTAFAEIGRRVWREQVGKLYSQALLDQVLAAVKGARATGSRASDSP